MAPTLITADPPEHRSYRALVSKPFAPRSVGDIRDAVVGATNDLVDEIIDDGCADLVASIALPLPLVIFCRLLGVSGMEFAQLKYYTEMLNDSFILDVAGFSKQRQLEIAHGVVGFQRWVMELVTRRRGEPGDDIVSRLIESPSPADPDRKLSDVEILSTVITMLSAGTETTMNLLGSSVRVLSDHPEQFAGVLADPALVPSAVDEVLRFESPVQCLFRNAKVDVEVGGTTIPAGGRVAVMYGAANRDPLMFADAERFDIHRHDASKALAFGKGEHFCLGSHLARLEGRVALATVLERMPNLRCSSGNDFRYRLNPLSRGLAALNAEWDVSRARR